MIYSLPRHELDKLPSASSLTWSSGDSQFMWQGSVEPSYPNSEINGVTLGAKRVSKVQRFMLPFKIRPIPAHKKKINCWACFVLEKKSIMVLANDPITLWIAGCPRHTPHGLLTSAVLSCISIGFCLGLRLKPPFIFPSLLSNLRSLLLFPKITVSVWTN